MVLQLAGHAVHLAHSGAKALEIAKQVRPDVAVLDIGMSDLSGYDAGQGDRDDLRAPRALGEFVWRRQVDPR
jgi:CheY-like chemotaxis protein